jgi:N-acetylglutamate synthase-like GNAT family acetyltransferase
MRIQLIQHNTPAYEKMIHLRITVLLNPIGVPASFIKREKEAEDILIGAFENDEIIGCCVLTKVDEKTVQLRQMAVDIAAQGTGIGASIVDFAETTAKEQGFHTLMMHARDVVIPFYEKCGYQTADDGFTEVGIPHHKMEKQL